MKISMLAIASIVLLLQATNINAFTATSPNKGAPKVGHSQAKSKVKERSTAKPVLSKKHASKRKKWGVDNDGEEDEYWFNQKIHTLGNTGFTGAIHAAMAPFSTFLIDAMAYEGVDIRHKVRAVLTRCLTFSCVVRNWSLTLFGSS